MMASFVILRQPVTTVVKALNNPIVRIEFSPLGAIDVSNGH